MKNGLLLFLISIFAASLALPQAAAPSGKKTTSKTAAKKTGTKTVSTKKGKSTKKSVRTAAAAPRYRQMTPTPERYKEIQQALAGKGYLKSEPNGVWDAQSADALTRFQADRKLPPTGKITSASLIGLGLGPKNDSPADAPPKPADPPVPAPENP